MTRHLSPDMAPDEFDRLLAAWMDADAQRREPEGLLEATLVRTGHTRRRPAWLLPERWIPMQLTMRLQPVPRIAGLLVILGLIVALVAAAVVIGSKRPLEPFGLAGNGRIAFVSEGDIYTANPDATNVVAVTSGPQIDGRPVWSHVDSKVAFFRWSSTAPAATADLMVFDVQAGTIVQVAEGAANLSVPSWSPDDRMLTFSYADGLGRPSVYTTPADGSEGPTRLEALGAAEAPVWSPDGARIAYTALIGTERTLYVANADGTAAEPLSRAYAVFGNGFSFGEMGLAWSPDGGRVVFAAGSEAGITQLYLVDAAGGSTEKLIRSGTETAYSPSWSPDGKRIAYLGGAPFDHPYLMVANADGSDSRRLINEALFYLTPQWSPDGTMIVVHPSPVTPDDPPIWLVDSATGTVRAKVSTTPASYEDGTPGSADIWSFERVAP
jgi:Tol biopolymer transport system component